MKRILGIVLMVVLLLAGCAAPIEESREAYVPVEVNPVSRVNIRQRAALSGILQAKQSATVMVPLTASVEQVNVRLGQWVEEDEVLFRLDEEAIANQVEQASAAFQQAKAAYESNLEQLQLAQTTAERMQRLYEAGAVSKAEVEQAQLAVSPENMAVLLSGFQQAKTVYDQSQSLMNDLAVKAPISGVISFLGVAENGFVAPGQPAAMIVDASTMKVAVNLPSKLISLIRLKDQVELEVPAAQLTETGFVVAIGPSVDQQTFLYPVEIEMENPDGVMLPGMFAKVYLVTESRENVIAVPLESVVESLGRKRVFVQVGDRAEARTVETGLDDGVYVEILSGIDEGESLIVVGQNFLVDGDRILVVEE